MSLPLQDPRLVPPQAADNAAVARERRQAEEKLARALIAAHHRVFPGDHDIEYTVTQRRGKVKVRFLPPVVKEAGYVDA